MNIVIVEDHPVVLYGLIEILENKLQASSIKGFCTPTKAECQVNWQSVDLVIVDFEFKSKDCGINFAKSLRSKYSNLRIIAYSSHKIFSVLNQLKRTGFNSYECKEMPIKDFITTINRVLNQPVNYFYESESYKKYMLERKTVENKFFSSKYERDISLTPTERAVCNKIIFTPKIDNSVLAKELDMKLNTLKKHITSIYKKLDVRSKEGIALALESSFA